MWMLHNMSRIQKKEEVMDLNFFLWLYPIFGVASTLYRIVDIECVYACRWGVFFRILSRMHLHDTG